MVCEQELSCGPFHRSLWVLLPPNKVRGPVSAEIRLLGTEEKGALVTVCPFVSQFSVQLKLCWLFLASAPSIAASHSALQSCVIPAPSRPIPFTPFLSF